MKRALLLLRLVTVTVSLAACTTPAADPAPAPAPDTEGDRAAEAVETSVPATPVETATANVPDATPPEVPPAATPVREDSDPVPVGDEAKDDSARPSGPPPPPRPPPEAELTPEITADQFLTRAAFLASDQLEGRESGTAFGAATEDYVAAEFRRMGFEFLGAQDTASPFQEVGMPLRTPLPYRSGVEVATADGFGERIASPPFAFCKATTVEGGLAFVGYGLSDADNGYDDYAGVDVKGRVVIVLRHGPREADEQSPWYRGNREAARKLAFSAKAAAAQQHGAAAVLLVQDMHHKAAYLPVSVPGPELAIPVLNVTRETADALLTATGRDLASLQKAIDADTRPQSFLVPGARVRVTAALGDARARNIVALKRGTDPKLSQEAVILCAHMDHVGHGWFGSPSGPGSIHNGADDNASGTAAVLEVAEALAAAPATRRSILIATWCGEEKGLVGSAYFVRNPLWDLKRITTCVNLDMVGRYRAGAEDAGLTIGGAPTGSGLEERILRLGAKHDVKITQAWTAWNQSDHAAFYAADVPALFFSTGLHADYHRPGDDWWKLAAPDAARIAQMARDLVVELADADERPAFKKKPPRPILGVRLGDAPDAGGAVIVQTFPRLGAARAGLATGDVIVAFGGAPVTSAADLSPLIAQSKPGTDVEVRYVRKGEEITVKVRISGM